MRCTFLFLFLCLCSILAVINSHVLNTIKCSGPPDLASCKKKILQWHYDYEQRECMVFIWGGCVGNELNRFESEEECLNECSLSELKFTGKKLIFSVRSSGEQHEIGARAAAHVPRNRRPEDVHVRPVEYVHPN